MEKSVDDLIEEWNNSDSNLHLHEYLGMTWDEYCRWVEQINPNKF